MQVGFRHFEFEKFRGDRGELNFIIAKTAIVSIGSNNDTPPAMSFNCFTFMSFPCCMG